jgi:hypothetical protein
MSDLQAWGAGVVLTLLLMIAEQVGVPSSSIRWLCWVAMGALIGVWMHS